VSTSSYLGVPRACYADYAWDISEPARLLLDQNLIQQEPPHGVVLVVPEPARDEVDLDSVQEGHERCLVGDRVIHFSPRLPGGRVLSRDLGRVLHHPVDVSVAEATVVRVWEQVAPEQGRGEIRGGRVVGEPPRRGDLDLSAGVGEGSEVGSVGCPRISSSALTGPYSSVPHNSAITLMSLPRSRAATPREVRRPHLARSRSLPDQRANPLRPGRGEQHAGCYPVAISSEHRSLASDGIEDHAQIGGARFKVRRWDVPAGETCASTIVQDQPGER
jgi:hypothetical protein